MEFNIRRVVDYAEVTVEIGNTKHDLGLLDRQQIHDMLDSLEEARDDLLWVLQVTDKG